MRACTDNFCQKLSKVITSVHLLNQVTTHRLFRKCQSEILFLIGHPRIHRHTQ